MGYSKEVCYECGQAIRPWPDRRVPSHICDDCLARIEADCRELTLRQLAEELVGRDHERILRAMNQERKAPLLELGQ